MAVIVGRRWVKKKKYVLTSAGALALIQSGWVSWSLGKAGVE